MSPDSTATQPRASAEFVESSILEALVPSHSSIDLEDELESWDGSSEAGNGSVFPFIVQRQFLLFDELVPVYIILKTPLVDKNTLKSYLTRLAISLETFAFSTAPNPESSEKSAPPPKELIFSETIKDPHQPLLIHSKHEPEASAYIVWKLNVFISRPRGKFYRPAVYFAPTASLKPPEKNTRPLLEDEYLPSNVPTAVNLLQHFEDDPGLAGIQPRLSALRISKVAPTAPVAKELVRPIRSGQRRLFRAAPGLTWRMRYSKLQSPLSDSALMASLDLEVATFTGSNVCVDNITLTLQRGRVEPIGESEVTKAWNKPGDVTTCLYRIIPDLGSHDSSIGVGTGHILALNIKARALVSEDCQAQLSIEWKTNVDFAMDHGPGMRRSLQLDGKSVIQHLPKAPGPDTLPSHDQKSQQGEGQSQVLNITVTVSGPPRVQVGNNFHWDLFIVNRAENSRKLAILIIPKRRRESEKHRMRPSSSSTGGRRGSTERLLAGAVLDENIVYAKQKSSKQEPADLVCLTTDVRIGHLPPGGCYTADLQFLALRSGVLNVDALRIVDLATQEVADIRELPTIVAAD